MPGRAFIRFHANADGVLSVPEVKAQAADLDLAARAVLVTGDDSFAYDSCSFPIEIRRQWWRPLDLPETGTPFIRLGGNSLDLRPLMDDVFGDDGDDDADGTPAMRIAVDEASPLGSVRLGAETRL